MKKGFFLYLFVTSSFFCHAQDEYSVYRMLGNIQYKSIGGNWCSLTLHQYVNPKDSIYIPGGGFVEFKEHSSCQLFPSQTSGYMTVDYILCNVKSSNQSLTKQATEAVINELKKLNNKNDFSSYGGTFRNMSTDSQVENDVFSIIKQVVWSVKNGNLAEDSLCFARPSVIDEGVCYTIVNPSDEFLCVNILTIDTVHHMVHFLYNKSSLADGVSYLLVSPRSETKLDMIRFSPMSNFVLLTFATPFVYNVSKVDMKLKHWKRWNDCGEIPYQRKPDWCHVNIVR